MRNRAAQILSLVAVFSLGCRDIEAIEAPPALEDLSTVDRARVELGQRLFFDARLSADGTVSCASCHAPESAGADAGAVSLGVGEQAGRRNTPSVFNVAYKEHLFWDGRAATLEEQALMPLRAEAEMGAKDEDVLAYLAGDSGYANLVARAFPGEALGIQHVARRSPPTNGSSRRPAVSMHTSRGTRLRFLRKRRAAPNSSAATAPSATTVRGSAGSVSRSSATTRRGLPIAATISVASR